MVQDLQVSPRESVVYFHLVHECSNGIYVYNMYMRIAITYVFILRVTGTTNMASVICKNFKFRNKCNPNTEGKPIRDDYQRNLKTLVGDFYRIKYGFELWLKKLYLKGI